MKRQVGKYIIGGILIAAAVLLAGNLFDWWDVDLVFKGWWAVLFIFLPCFIGIITKGFHVFDFCGVVLGVLCFLAARGIIQEWNLVWQIMIPVILLAIGLSFIFKKRLTSEARSKAESYEKSNSVKESYSAVFSSNTPNVPADTKSISCSAVFGSINLDLTNLTFEDEVFVDLEAVFGGINIAVPKGIKIISSIDGIFGGVDYKIDKDETSTKVLYLTGEAVFGGIDVVNYLK